MYVHLQCLHIYIYSIPYILILSLIFFLFTASSKKKRFKCIFKFLSMLFSAASVVYSIRIWWNLFCCSIPRNTKNLHSFFFVHISPLSSSLRSKEINAFNHTFWKGIRAKTFWYFSVVFFFFLYLVISCFLNWFLFFFLLFPSPLALLCFHQYLCCSSFLHE